MTKTTINPKSRCFVIKNNDGEVVGKFDTNSAVSVPIEQSMFEVVELSTKESLSDYQYDSSVGFQS